MPFIAQYEHGSLNLGSAYLPRRPCFVLWPKSWWLTIISWEIVSCYIVLSPYHRLFPACLQPWRWNRNQRLTWPQLVSLWSPTFLSHDGLLTASNFPPSTGLCKCVLLSRVILNFTMTFSPSESPPRPVWLVFSLSSVPPRFQASYRLYSTSHQNLLTKWMWLALCTKKHGFSLVLLLANCQHCAWDVST